MNFNKIKELCEERKMTIPMLASKIGISEPGLYQAFRNKSMKVDILEKIAEALIVPIWTFFDLDPETPLKAKLEKLRKENTELQETVESQKKLITYLHQKLEDAEHTLKLQDNIIHKQSEINEAKERLIEEKERSIKNNEAFLNLLKTAFPDKIFEG